MTRRRLGLAAVSLGLVALAALALAWTQRRTIASDVIDRRLRAYGVAATYRVVAIGPGASNGSRTCGSAIRAIPT